MKTLVIVEAPSKARHIQQFLGRDYVVKASVGHIRELPEPKAMTKEEKQIYGDVAQTLDEFKPLFRVSPDKKRIVSELKSALKTADQLVLATDPDREGDSISWHLLQELKPKVPTFRATWNEITEKAVKEGLAQKKLIEEAKKEPKEFFNSVESALTRAQWDRLYGYTSSPYLWRVLKPGTSSGRVQTPGTRLVVEREEKRLNFKSVAFYTIWGDFEGNKAKLTTYKGQKVADGSKLNDQGELEKGYLLITDQNLKPILQDLEEDSYKIGTVTSRPYRRSPQPPFTTSSALQSIGAKTRLSAKALTHYLQDLYASEGAITYIRTVSVEAAPEAIAEARKELEKLYGKKFVPPTPRVYRDKNSSNSGHECIRPVLDDKSGKLVNRHYTDQKLQTVFNLVRQRFLASQAIDCEGTTWSATFDSLEEDTSFIASETEIHEPGWTAIYALDQEVGA